MNILAIDFGKKRFGLAWVQSGIDVILPFGIVKAENALAEITRIITEESIDRVIIGEPKALSGGEGQMEASVREFGRTLAESTGKTIVYIDERFTSRQADAMGGGLSTGTCPRLRTGLSFGMTPQEEAGASRDEKAAMLILETYLASLSL